MQLAKAFFITLVYLLTTSATSKLSGQYPDSLLNKSFDELKEIYVPMDRDSLSAVPYIRAFMAKAKQANDTLRIARAYMDLGWISSPEVEAKYADSIIFLTKDMTHKTFPAYGYATKAEWQYNNNLFEESLENYLLAYESALNSGNKTRQERYRFNIAGLKSRVGEYEDAIEVFKEIYKGEISKKDNYTGKRADILFNIYNNYSMLGRLDSAEWYLSEGIKVSRAVEDSNMYHKLFANKGILAYHKGNYPKALNILSQTLPYRVGEEKAISFYYLGKTNFKLNRLNKAIDNFKISDSISQAENYTFPELLDVYKILTEYYGGIGRFQDQVYYYDKYLNLDSIMDMEYKVLKKRLITDFDVPELKRENKKIVDFLDSRNDKYERFILIFSFLVILLTITLIYHLRKKEILKRRFRTLVNSEQKSNENAKSITTDKIHDIPSATLKGIRNNLDEFEQKLGFLSNSLSMNELAKSFQSNSSYLSKVINNDKKKSFSSYINDLRIDFVVKKLKEDSKFRKFNIRAISHEVGFNNPESFSKAFYKRTNMYPSYFIKQLEKYKV